MSRYLIDTNVFSEIFKANDLVAGIVADLDAYIDIVIYIECIQGSKSNSEKAKIDKLLSTFELLPMSEHVGNLALSLIHQYSNSHGLLLPDALIASSAVTANLTLVTYNLADFRFISGLAIERPEDIAD